MIEKDSSKWFDLYHKALLNYAYTMVNDLNLAADMVQETYYSALKGEDRLKDKKNVRAWLFVILKRKIIDYWRKQNTRKVLAITNLVSSESREIFETTIFRMVENPDLENEELNKVLNDCMTCLPPKWYSIFTDSFINHLSYKEICSRYNISNSNFWVIIHRSKLKMRECLGKNWLD